ELSVEDGRLPALPADRRCSRGQAARRSRLSSRRRPERRRLADDGPQHREAPSDCNGADEPAKRAIADGCRYCLLLPSEALAAAAAHTYKPGAGMIASFLARRCFGVGLRITHSAFNAA